MVKNKRLMIMIILITLILTLNSQLDAVEIEIKADIPAKLRSRITDLYPKVCDILGMYPDDFEVNIILFKNDAEMNRALGGTNSPTGAYHFPSNTLYLSRKSLTDEVLAHELAHTICCRYSKITVKSQEILAGYCQYIITKGGKNGKK